MYITNLILLYSIYCLSNILASYCAQNEHPTLDTTTVKIFLAYPELFNFILEKYNENTRFELDDLLQKIKNTNFEFFRGKLEKDMLPMLTSYKKNKGRRGKGSKRTPIFKTFKDRWNRDRKWKCMFSDIVSNLVTRITNHCFRKGCSHKASSHDKATRIGYAFHFDHQKNEGQWHKINDVSQLRHDGKAMMIELIKCRMACAYDHEFGSGTDWYEEMLAMKSTHQYSCGSTHRSIKKIVNTRNMKALKTEIDSRGGFKSIRDVTKAVSFGTLQVLFWKYARVDFAALVNCTEDVFMEQNATSSTASTRRRSMAIVAYINLIKKLAVKCPGYRTCGSKFSDLVGVQLSGAHMDHRGKKRMGISKAINSSKSIEWIIEELISGNCVPTCAFCHGEITAWENGREDKPDFML